MKLFSMREHLPVSYIISGSHVIHYSCLILVYIILTNAYVKMCISRRQYAWVESKRLLFTHQRLNEEHLNNKNKIWFEQWLVGFTDGDGNFSITHEGDKWGLSYKLVQSRYNLRVLYYIKKQLGLGSVTIHNSKGQFLIRNRKIIETVILPIFDKYPFFTSNYFDSLRFKKTLDILNNISLTNKEKDIKLLNFLNLKVPDNYKSPAWHDVFLPLKDVSSIKSVMSKAWLVGFVEAEGSFCLTSKDSKRIVHAYGLTQKLDEIVLQSIGLILHISNCVSYKEIYNHYILDTTNSRAIENIIVYFKDTMKGVKSLEYRIWARSYNRNKGDYDKLHKIRNMVINLRKNLLEIM